MGDDVLGVITVAFLLAVAHLLTCPACRQRVVDRLDQLVERIAFGRKNP